MTPAVDAATSWFAWNFDLHRGWAKAPVRRQPNEPDVRNFHRSRATTSTHHCRQVKARQHVFQHMDGARGWLPTNTKENDPFTRLGLISKRTREPIVHDIIHCIQTAYVINNENVRCPGCCRVPPRRPDPAPIPLRSVGGAHPPISKRTREPIWCDKNRSHQMVYLIRNEIVRRSGAGGVGAWAWFKGTQTEAASTLLGNGVRRSHQTNSKILCNSLIENKKHFSIQAHQRRTGRPRRGQLPPCPPASCFLDEWQSTPATSSEPV
jgi:hypothetical protein